MISGKIVKLNMRGIDRNRKGANHASSRQYPVGMVLVGWWMALGYLGAGVLNCITIIGIPFGLQSFKMAKLALWPFGAEIVNL